MKLSKPSNSQISGFSSRKSSEFILVQACLAALGGYLGSAASMLFLATVGLARSQPIGVDKQTAVVVLFQPPVGEVFREPARCFFCCQSAVFTDY
jgi:hypothetical protein